MPPPCLQFSAMQHALLDGWPTINPDRTNGAPDDGTAKRHEGLVDRVSKITPPPCTRPKDRHACALGASPCGMDPEWSAANAACSSALARAAYSFSVVSSQASHARVPDIRTTSCGIRATTGASSTTGARVEGRAGAPMFAHIEAFVTAQSHGTPIAFHDSRGRSPWSGYNPSSARVSAGEATSRSSRTAIADAFSTSSALELARRSRRSRRLSSSPTRTWPPSAHAVAARWN